MNRIGIIGAMEIEVEQLKERMEINSVQIKAGMEFCEGTYGSNDVVIVRSGIGESQCRYMYAGLLLTATMFKW